MARTRRDYQRWARRGTTAERGYGWQHQAERDRRLATWKPGDPCARCGRPMLTRWLMHNGRRISAIDLGHTADRTGYTGLEHRHCNRGEGARRGNQQRGRARAWRTARQW